MSTQQREVPKEYANTKAPASQIQRKWWTLEKETACTHVVGVAKDIDTRQRYRLEEDAHHARLYSNKEWRAHSIALWGSAPPLPINRFPISLNVIKSCVDTAAAKVAKNKTRPLFLTEKGKWKEQIRAKGLTQYLDGLFDDEKMYERGALSFKHGSVYGTGPCQVFAGKDKVCYEPTLPSHLLVDDVEGVFGNPRTMYKRKWVHREVLLDQFGDDKNAAAAIMAATGGENMLHVSPQSQDIIYAVEAWHLPSSRNSKDGRRALCIENFTLEFSEWNRDYFPFAIFRWSPRLLGFYGGGIPEEIQGIQIEINRILRDTAEAFRLYSVPRVLKNANTKVKSITNEIGSFLEWEGVDAPDFFTPSAFPPEVYRHLWELVQRAKEQIGISELSSGGRKPAGLDSGKALREYSDIETERLSLASLCLQQFYLDIAKMTIDATRDLSESGVKLSALGRDGKFLRKIDWANVDIEEDKYVMRAFPANLLPTQPAGKLATVQEMIDSELIDREYALSLLDFPDLEDVVSLQTAAVEDIKRSLSLMIDEGVPQVPEPYTNLDLAVRMGVSAALRAKDEGCPDENLDLVRRYLSQCMKLLGQQQAQQTAAQSPQVVPPGAIPPQAVQVPQAPVPQGPAPVPVQ